MAAFSHSQASDHSAHSLHPALSGANGSQAITPTILVCPLPLSTLSPEELLPELGHELKTPLTGIMGLAQVMQRQTHSMGDRESQYAGLIYQKSQQLLIAINDLLDFTQLCTHQFVLQLQAVELHSTLRTALQATQRTVGLDHISVLIDQDDSPEHWMVADRARVEQFLTHLLGYLLLQSPSGANVHVRLCPWGDWMIITLGAHPLYLSETEQVSLGWPSQPSPFNASAVPCRSSAVLKFLLARRLAHLQGAEMTWSSEVSSGTEVTVLFPRDLTRTTALARSHSPAPLYLLLAQQSNLIREVTQVLRQQGNRWVVARSLPEARDKVQILAPTLWVIDSQFAEACGLSVFQSWLVQQSIGHKITLIWLGYSPFESQITWPHPMEVWPFPLSSIERIKTSLSALPSRQLSLGKDSIPQRSSPVPQTSKPAQATPRPLTLLQLDSVSGAEAPDPWILELLTWLSQHHGCSILAVNDQEQADLLARIWQPTVIICPGSLPNWAYALPATSRLARLPLFLLQSIEPQQNPPHFSSVHLMPSVASPPPSSKALAEQLYQRLTEAALDQGDQRPKLPESLV